MWRIRATIGGILAIIIVGILYINEVEIETEVTRRQTKVGFLLNGSTQDCSWGQSHYEGMEIAAKALNLDVHYRENVPENEECMKVMEELIAQDVRITVFRRDTLRELSEAVKHLKQKGVYRKALVHIKVDTGMSRIGILPDENGMMFIKEAYETEGIEVEGIFTHFARGDEKDKTFTNKQLHTFKEFVAKYMYTK